MDVMEQMACEVEVKDLGPVVEFEAVVGPGLNVLVGTQGAGKSTILRALQLCVDGRADGDVTKRIGSKGGSISVGERILRIAKTTRTEGELAIEGTGDLSINNLHWPAFKDASVRDARRIATLCRLTGLTLRVNDFQQVLGPDFSFVDATAVSGDDAVSVAASVKRQVDRLALEKGKTAEALMSKAVGLAGGFEGDDVVSPLRLDELSEARDKALANQTDAIARDRMSREHEQRAAADAQRIAALRGTISDGLDVALSLAQNEHAEAQREVKAAEVAEALARQTLEGVTTKRKACEQVLKTRHVALNVAIKRSDEDAKARAAIEEIESRLVASVAKPTAEELTEAANALASATAALAAEKAREAKIRMAEAHTQTVREAEVAQKRSEQLRRKAGEVADVLSEAVKKIPDCPLTVKFDDNGDARLMFFSEKRGSLLFDDLSDGERWEIAIRLAVKNGRLVVLPQAAFGELAPSTCRRIHDLALACGGAIVTAKADDTALRLVSYPELKG